MTQVRTNGLEQELLAGHAASVVGAGEEERDRVAEARQAERHETLERLERDAKGDD